MYKDAVSQMMKMDKMEIVELMTYNREELYKRDNMFQLKCLEVANKQADLTKKTLKKLIRSATENQEKMDQKMKEYKILSTQRDLIRAKE